MKVGPQLSPSQQVSSSRHSNSSKNAKIKFVKDNQSGTKRKEWQKLACRLSLANCRLIAQNSSQASSKLELRIVIKTIFLKTKFEKLTLSVVQFIINRNLINQCASLQLRPEQTS